MRFSGSRNSFCAARRLCAGKQLLSELAQDILRKHERATSAYMNILIKNKDIVTKYASTVRLGLFVVMRLVGWFLCNRFFNLQELPSPTLEVILDTGIRHSDRAVECLSDYVEELKLVTEYVRCRLFCRCAVLSIQLAFFFSLFVCVRARVCVCVCVFVCVEQSSCSYCH